MSQIRRVVRSWKSVPTIEGAGVHLKRALGFQGLSPESIRSFCSMTFIPTVRQKYLPGFPWHPHRGIETITYVLEGKVAHVTAWELGIIGIGDVQWMTAGSGIIHQEMPEGETDGRLWGLQLWTNLPSSHKMMSPRYRELKLKTSQKLF